MVLDTFLKVFAGGALGAIAAELLRWAHRMQVQRLPTSKKGWVRQGSASGLLILGGGLVASLHTGRVQDLLVIAQLGIVAPALLRAWVSGAASTTEKEVLGEGAHGFGTELKDQDVQEKSDLAIDEDWVAAFRW